MAAIWAELLGTEPASAEDSFFATGGHSLLVLPLLHRIGERFGVEVSLREYFANPTLIDLSALVESQFVARKAATKTMTG